MSTDFKESISPAYPNLAPATDSKEMYYRISPELPAIWGDEVSLKSLEIPRVFPRPNGDFLIQYQLKVENLYGRGEKNIFLFGYLAGESKPTPDLKNIDDVNSMKFDDLRLTIPIFPFDPRLRDLPRFIERDFILDCFNKIPGSDVGYNKLVRLDVLSYRIESRCVIRYSIHDSAAEIDNQAGNAVIAKIYRPRRLSGALKVLKSLESEEFSLKSGNKFSVSRVLLVDEKKGFMLLDEASGKSLHFLLTKAIFQEGCAAAGELLRVLHSANPEKLGEYTAFDELADLENKSLIAFGIFPDLKEPGQRIFTKLKDVREGYLRNEYRVFAHRDFYDKQIMYSEIRATLLDCDNAVSADPALDYGNFLAHLILRVLQYPEHSGNIQKGETAFIEGYSNFSDDFRLRARWWKAATLLRLILLYSYRPRWHKLTGELIDRANKILDNQI